MAKKRGQPKKGKTRRTKGGKKSRPASSNTAAATPVVPPPHVAAQPPVSTAQSLPITEENLAQAFAETVKATGIGAATGDFDKLLAQKVFKVVPVPMQASYPARLLAVAEAVCSDAPFLWLVIGKVPSIDDVTTFGNLYRSWFHDIIFKK